jgi:hypothetical protein
MPRKDGVVREIAEKSTIKAENSLKIGQKQPSPEKLTTNVEGLGGSRNRLSTIPNLWRSH